MLLETNFIHDERVIKSARSLAEVGYEIHVLCPGDESISFLVERGVTCHRFKINQWLMNKLLATCLIQPFYFWMWRKETRKLIQTIGSPEVIYTHDLPLSSVGVWVQRRYKSRLVCDQHEFYTDWIRQTHHMNTLLGKIVSLLSNWNLYERKYLTKADLVISVLEPLCDLYAQHYPEIKNKIIHLPNTPLQRLYKNRPEDPELRARFIKEANWRLVYVGSTLTKERRIDLIMDALPKVKERIPELKLLILGQVHRSFDLINSIKQNGLENVVEYEGRVPFERIPEYLKYCQIGLNMHDLSAGREVHESIFTKVFHYIGAHLAVVTTRLRVMSELVMNREIGIIVDDNSDDLASNLIELLQDRTTLKKYQENTKKCDDLFWEKTSRYWLEQMQRL